LSPVFHQGHNGYSSRREVSGFSQHFWDFPQIPLEAPFSNNLFGPLFPKIYSPFFFDPKGCRLCGPLFFGDNHISPGTSVTPFSPLFTFRFHTGFWTPRAFVTPFLGGNHPSFDPGRDCRLGGKWLASFIAPPLFPYLWGLRWSSKQRFSTRENYWHGPPQKGGEHNGGGGTPPFRLAVLLCSHQAFPGALYRGAWLVITHLSGRRASPHVSC